MNMREKYEDGPPNVVVTSGSLPEFYRKALEETASGANAGVLHFDGGPVDTRGMRASHGPGVTPTTIRNTKLTRPAEQYPGEAERMIDTWTKLATTAIVKARDATDAVRLVSHLEEAAHAIQEALRWAKS